jgi:hypothetical protein
VNTIVLIAIAIIGMWLVGMPSPFACSTAITIGGLDNEHRN